LLIISGISNCLPPGLERTMKRKEEKCKKGEANRGEKGRDEVVKRVLKINIS